MDSFSKRQGLVPEKAIQIDSMDEPLRNSLWNAATILFGGYVPTGPTCGYEDVIADQRLETLVLRLWALHFRWPIDGMPGSWSEIKSEIRRKYFEMKWYETYDFVEFIAGESGESNARASESFRNLCNDYLARESSGYRFVGDIITPITDKEEIAEVRAALATFHDTVGIQLESALAKLADRQNPDYRNSIKDAISAVETVVNLINGTTNKTLGDALKKISGAIDLHPALAKGLDSIYGWTSDDKGGIRHAMMEKKEVTAADARFMLVSCSAFVNHLIAKAEQAGIKLKT